MKSYFPERNQLVHLLHTNNRVTRPLGVNILRKFINYKPISLRLYLLLTALWLDTFYTILITFIPTSEEELLLKLGDYAYHLVGHNRYFMSGVMIFYRLSSTIMVTCFVLDPFGWLREANLIFEKMKNATLVSRLIRTRNRCKIVAVVAISYLSSMVMSALLMCTIIYKERNSKYELTPAYIYICYYSIMYTSLHVQFMIELYFLCKICTALFDQLNGEIKREILQKKQYRNFPGRYNHFSALCLFVQKVNSYTVRIYITFFVCNLTVVVLLFYSALYANFNLISKAIYITFLLVELAFIVFFSHVIGSIDKKAKQLGDEMYAEFSLKQSNQNRFVKNFSSQLMRYFQTVFGSTISMVILDSPINSNTSIKILTIVLTVFAFLMNNFHQG